MRHFAVSFVISSLIVGALACKRAPADVDHVVASSPSAPVDAAPSEAGTASLSAAAAPSEAGTTSAAVNAVVVAPTIATRIVNGELVIEELGADAGIGAAAAPSTSDTLNVVDASIARSASTATTATTATAPEMPDSECGAPRSEMAALVDAAKRGPAVPVDAARAVFRNSGGCRMNKEVRRGLAQILVGAAKPVVDPRSRRELLENAVDLAPDATSLEMLGDAADDTNDLRFALERYREAFALSPRNGGLRWKIADLEKKLAVEGGFDKRESQHFVARFEGGERNDLADTTLAVLDGSRKKLKERLGLEAPTPITVVLYVGDQYQRASSGPDWSGGVYDGKIRVREGDLKATRGTLEDLLVHEYVHALIGTALKGKVPAWFNEGLAQYCEPGTDRTRMNRRRETTKRSDLPSLTTLSVGFGRQRDANIARSYYDYALDLVDEMARWRTERSFASLFEAMNAGKSFNAAFDDVYGMDLALFESRWRERYQ